MQGLIKKTKAKFRLLISLFVFFVFGNQISITNGEGNEYYIKAMYVLNFMKYVEWPEEDRKDTFKIGIIGKSEIYDALQSMVLDRKENKKILIEKINSSSNENYEIIIIPKSEIKKIEEVVKRYLNKGVLIISDECNNSGAAINLLNIDNKIRFEINTNQARIGGIKISSKLIELAVSVKP